MIEIRIKSPLPEKDGSRKQRSQSSVRITNPACKGRSFNEQTFPTSNKWEEESTVTFARSKEFLNEGDSWSSLYQSPNKSNRYLLVSPTSKPSLKMMSFALAEPLAEVNQNIVPDDYFSKENELVLNLIWNKLQSDRVLIEDFRNGLGLYNSEYIIDKLRKNSNERKLLYRNYASREKIRSSHEKHNIMIKKQLEEQMKRKLWNEYSPRPKNETTGFLNYSSIYNKNEFDSRNKIVSRKK